MHSSAVIQAVAVTAELCGRTFTPAAAAVFCDDLEAYPEQSVLQALSKCRREVRGVLTTQDVISRIDDGRPGPEEAWALLPTREDETVVWTAEMREAYGEIYHLMVTDRVAARMSFKEIYSRLVTKSRDEGRAVEQDISLGHDPESRKRVLKAAIDAGRISIEQARQADPVLLPAPVPEELLALPDETPKRVSARAAATAAADAIRKGPADALEWARKLRTLDQGGLHITDAQRAAYKAALGSAPTKHFPGDFIPIPEECLPPGMRGQR